MDYLIHSIAFSPKGALHGRVIDVSKEGFLATMDVSCWSFLRMAHLAEPLMKNGGSMFAMTYYGSERVVMQNDTFLVIAPYASRFPFETWILPRKHDSTYELSPAVNFGDLARALKSLFQRLDAVLDHPAYNLVLHSAPIQDQPSEHYHWHIEIIPRLTKTAGFEWGTGFYINPVPPEDAATFLREVELEMPVVAAVEAKKAGK